MERKFGGVIILLETVYIKERTTGKSARVLNCYKGDGTEK